jgi:hypothetical protein
VALDTSGRNDWKGEMGYVPLPLDCARAPCASARYDYDGNGSRWSKRQVYVVPRLGVLSVSCFAQASIPARGPLWPMWHSNLPILSNTVIRRCLRRVSPGPFFSSNKCALGYRISFWFSIARLLKLLDLVPLLPEQYVDTRYHHRRDNVLWKIELEMRRAPIVT